jgi:hypothetical protein
MCITQIYFTSDVWNYHIYFISKSLIRCLETKLDTNLAEADILEKKQKKK